ncbi:hypothetical protein JMJ35_006817 [Cladonia borealis]|uniref:Uncharacterized protein n=1 Tax=Cladonia borealis TaxID=184061 RepID=A0AA39QWB9_9LECA|nr:hypothetical protein JMJ35_006817 [Cladonia borealis]
MLVQKFTQQSARRLLANPPTLSRFAPPAAIAANRIRLQTRPAAFAPSSSPIQTTPAKPSDAYSILAAQRLQRPISPHLSIYKPQLTWYLSALNRITGCALSGGFYIFGAAYLASPLLGWHLESATMAEWFGGLGAVTKGGIKMAVALPFAFHSWNGVRHLVWDTGRELSNRQVVVTGYIVMGLTVVSSGYLAFFV